MKDHDRAAQLWSLLVLAARNQQFLSYVNLQQLTGMDHQSICESLVLVQNYCERRQLPPLTFIVVNEPTGMPCPSLMEEKEVFGAQARVFVHDWFGHRAPSPEDFQKITN